MSKSNENAVKYAYIRDQRDPRRVMTIARRWGKNHKKIQYQYAICNPEQDQHRKETGREWALDRLESFPLKFKPEQGEMILRAVIADIFSAPNSDRNSKAMTAQWLMAYDSQDNAPWNKENDSGNWDHDECESDCDGSCEGCDPDLGCAQAPSASRQRRDLDDADGVRTMEYRAGEDDEALVARIAKRVMAKLAEGSESTLDHSKCDAGCALAGIGR